MPVTVTYTPRVSRTGEEVNRVALDWTSDGAGAATQSVELYGYLVKATTVPTNSPTALYDLTLIDSDGAACDAFMGLLADRSATLTETKYMTPSGNAVPILLCGTYTFTVANAGATKSGSCYLYLVDSL